MQKKIYNLVKLLILLGIFFNVGSIFAFIFMKLGFDINLFNYADSAYADTLIEIFLALVVFAFYHRKFFNDWHEFNQNLKVNLKKCLMLFGILLLVKIGASVATSIISMILGMEFLQSNNQNILDLLISSAPIMMLISSVVLAPFVEEGIFRLGFKKVIKNKKAYILISGLTFGLMHIFPTDLNIALALIQSVVYVALGITLAYIYERKNNIYFVIIAHALNNLLGILAALILL